MKFLIHLKAILSRILEYMVIVIMGALVLVILLEIAGQLVAMKPRWTSELACFLLIWGGLLGGSVGFSRKAHLGIDYVVTKLDFLSQKLANVIAGVIVVAFAGYVMVYGALKMICSILDTQQVSTAMGIPMGYVYLALPISGVFIILFSLEHIMEVFTDSEAIALEEDAEDFNIELEEV